MVSPLLPITKPTTSRGTGIYQKSSKVLSKMSSLKMDTIQRRACFQEMSELTIILRLTLYGVLDLKKVLSCKKWISKTSWNETCNTGCPLYTESTTGFQL